MPSFRRRALRRTAPVALAALASLVFAATALAHATITPAVVKSGTLQQFSLSVPTEKSGAATTSVTLTVPAGFGIDSYESEPGWRRSVKATGSGDNAVVQSITWSGGHVPTEEDAVFRFNASANSNKTYLFNVRQTYSDGSVVDWTGPESSDTPAPTVEGISSFGGSGSTLAIIAIIVGAIALLVGLVALLTGRRPLA
jgi:uncharacterized protein YcnI